MPDVPTVPVEARVASAMQAAAARAIANRNEDERKRDRARAAHRHQVHGVVKIAMAQIGDGYAWGGNGPDAFDCSGLTAYAFASTGLTLPHNSQGQAARGRPVARHDIRPGDLVFFSTAGPGASHVGVATGATTVVSATNGGVMEHSTRDAYWGGHYVGARRLL
jgi:cell wall-associated NlpC family hydrolase